MAGVGPAVVVDAHVTPFNYDKLSIGALSAQSCLSWLVLLLKAPGCLAQLLSAASSTRHQNLSKQATRGLNHCRTPTASPQLPPLRYVRQDSHLWSVLHDGMLTTGEPGQCH
jgi:hypothetical protein